MVEKAQKKLPGDRGTRTIITVNERQRLTNEIVILQSRELAEKVINKIGIENIYPDMPMPVASMIFQSSLTGVAVRLD